MDGKTYAIAIAVIAIVSALSNCLVVSMMLPSSPVKSHDGPYRFECTIEYGGAWAGSISMDRQAYSIDGEGNATYPLHGNVSVLVQKAEADHAVLRLSFVSSGKAIASVSTAAARGQASLTRLW